MASSPLSADPRSLQLSRLKEVREWDVVVIGGGASGLGIALEAVTRGYSTLLLEASDFAKGTSSRSTKLIHGGVRYLAQGDIRLVREASVERGLLYRNAPHLVRKLAFIIPVYSYFNRFRYALGMKFYDAIAGSLRLGASVFLNREHVLKRLPTVKSKGLKGGILYHDGQFDDARLAVTLMQTIVDRGGCALNYMKVSGLMKNREGKITGVTALDEETGTSYPVQARSVVNATGVFADGILQYDEPGSPSRIRVSQGVHLVLEKKFLPSSDALMIPETSDGRVLFALPWYDRIVIGTTDTPVDRALAEPRALEKEIDFILQTAEGYLVQKPRRADVCSVFAGLRPLAAPTGKKQKTKEISRSHKILVSSSGMLTMLGGKWTTFRKMGADLLDRLEREKGWPRRPSVTSSLRLHGYTEGMGSDDPVGFYGSDAGVIRAGMQREDGWISRQPPLHEAQVVWAVQHEMARTVEDVLARRVRYLLLHPQESLAMAPRVAALLQAELGRDRNWMEQQLDAYRQLVQGYLVTSENNGISS